MSASVWAGQVVASGPVAAQFVPGGREIASLDLAGTPIGQAPKGIRRLPGGVSVVEKDGARMLKASGAAEFILDLPEKLPDDFTLEFELIPKGCCNPEDLSFEGTPAMSRSSNSAQVVWSRDYVRVVGGGPPFEMAMPQDLRETLPSTLTKVSVNFEGETLKLYTNGRRLLTLTERRFVRGRVLRVFLGGQDEGEQAVYLARLRVGTGPPVIAQQPAQPTSVVLMPAPPTTGTTTPMPAPAPGSAPTTTAVTPMALPAPKSGEPLASGTSAGNVASAQLLPLFAPPPPRTILLSGFTAQGGFSVLTPRIIALAGFTATGGFSIVAPRTVILAGFSATGGFGPVAPRTIALAGFTATGVVSVLSPRSPAITGLPGSGGSSAVAPRTIALAGFTATGGFMVAASRTITLAGFTATGGSKVLASRIIPLAGFTATGGFGALAPRTIKLAGWTAAGSERTP